MPTHRVRQADSTEWTIAAYVPGLELTTADTAAVPAAEPEEETRSKLGSLVHRVTRKKGEGLRAENQEEPTSSRSATR